MCQRVAADAVLNQHARLDSDITAVVSTSGQFVAAVRSTFALLDGQSVPRNQERTMRRTSGLVAAACAASLLLSVRPAMAEATWTVGHINNVTFVGDVILIKTDSQLPDNCAGTGNGWIGIPAAYKQMHAFVLALWTRGDETSVQVVVYTTTVSGGYCWVTQIDPEG